MTSPYVLEWHNFHIVDFVLLFIILAPLQIFSLMAFKKCYLPQNVCLVPTLAPLNIHCVEKSDKHAHGPVSSARLCEKVFSERFEPCHSFELLILHSSSSRGFKVLMLLFGSMCMNNWESALYLYWTSLNLHMHDQKN
jgi:hypothetical protein